MLKCYLLSVFLLLSALPSSTRNVFSDQPCPMPVDYKAYPGLRGVGRLHSQFFGEKTDYKGCVVTLCAPDVVCMPAHCLVYNDPHQSNYGQIREMNFQFETGDSVLGKGKIVKIHRPSIRVLTTDTFYHPELDVACARLESKLNPSKYPAVKFSNIFETFGRSDVSYHLIEFNNGLLDIDRCHINEWSPIIESCHITGKITPIHAYAHSCSASVGNSGAPMLNLSSAKSGGVVSYGFFVGGRHGLETQGKPVPFSDYFANVNVDGAVVNAFLQDSMAAWGYSAK